MPHRELFRSNGSRIPSVTEIIGHEKQKQIDAAMLRKYKTPWRVQKKLEATRKIGREFHELIETNHCECTWRRLTTMSSVYQEWESSRNGYVLWEEETLLHSSEKFQGSFDRVWFEAGQLEIIDWKTGTRISEDAPIQLAAYRELLGDCFNLWVPQGRIVNIPAKRPHILKEKIYDLTNPTYTEEFYRRLSSYYGRAL